MINKWNVIMSWQYYRSLISYIDRYISVACSVQATEVTVLFSCIWCSGKFPIIVCVGLCVFHLYISRSHHSQAWVHVRHRLVFMSLTSLCSCHSQACVHVTHMPEFMSLTGLNLCHSHAWVHVTHMPEFMSLTGLNLCHSQAWVHVTHGPEFMFPKVHITHLPEFTLLSGLNSCHRPNFMPLASIEVGQYPT